MTAPIQHVLIASAVFAASALLTWLMLRARIIDIPNARSSHDAPVPRSGGAAIVLAFWVGAAVVYLLADGARIAGPAMLGFAAGALVIAAVGLLDDLFGLRFWLKLLGQFCAIACLIAFGLVLDGPLVGGSPLPGPAPAPLIGLGVAVTCLWVVALTNMFNFMDGLDGLAGGTGVIVAGFFGLIAQIEGAQFTAILSYFMMAACLGFTMFNFPPARIFMGDVGSQFLGYGFAVLAVIAAGFDGAPVSVLVMPLLFFNFIFDTVLTFMRRLMAGENVTQAHKSHLYQLVNRLGWSHRKVSLLHYAMSVAQGGGALWLISLPISDRPLAFVPFLAFELIYAAIVLRAAHRARLI